MISSNLGKVASEPVGNVLTDAVAAGDVDGRKRISTSQKVKIPPQHHGVWQPPVRLTENDLSNARGAQGECTRLLILKILVP
jgi:hypothetical protein